MASQLKSFDPGNIYVLPYMFMMTSCTKVKSGHMLSLNIIKNSVNIWKISVESSKVFRSKDIVSDMLDCPESGVKREAEAPVSPLAKKQKISKASGKTPKLVNSAGKRKGQVTELKAEAINGTSSPRLGQPVQSLSEITLWQASHLTLTRRAR